MHGLPPPRNFLLFSQSGRAEGSGARLRVREAAVVHRGRGYAQGLANGRAGITRKSRWLALKPLPSSYNNVADASSPSSLQLPIPRMQVREFEMTMATRWWDADDDEDTALPRIPWQTAAGSAWPWMHGRVSPAHLAHVCARSFPELLSKCRSESVLVLQAASRMPACRCRS